MGPALLGAQPSSRRPPPKRAAAVAVPAPPEAAPDPLEAERTRARVLGRLGRFDEALVAYRHLIARRFSDMELRAEYAETLVDAGEHELAAAVIAEALRTAPASTRLQRVRARLELERGDSRLAADRYRLLLPALLEDPSLLAELAGAELRHGAWRAALDRYAEILEREPENDEVRAAYQTLRRTYAPRFELAHRSLLQVSAATHVEELAWRGWVAERAWVRAGLRYGRYRQDDLPGQPGFEEDVVTALVAAGVQVAPRWMVRAGLEEAVRGDTARTTLRLGGAFDDGRATLAATDIGIRELLTNPVTAVPLRGTTDRVTVDLSRRLADRVTANARYEFRHYRASGDTLGNDWELTGRLDVEVLRGPLQLVVFPQLFFQEYAPVAGEPLRSQIQFIRRQDVGALGLLAALEPTPGLRLQVGAIGKRDWHRGITSYEVSGELRWRLQRWLEMVLLYTRTSEGARVGGKEENYLGTLSVLY